MSMDWLDQVDWSRMAEPQEDQYDTKTTLYFAQNATSKYRKNLYVRRPLGDSPTIFDSQVAVRHITPECPYSPPMENGPIHHPNIAAGSELLLSWPVVYKQFQALVDSFHPLWDSELPYEVDPAPLSSQSGAKEDLFGVVFATVEHPLTLAEALVHEMAHQKLHALGISIDSASRLIVNSPRELYESPIIRDRLRPMSAVFHAQYSFTYVTELDSRLVNYVQDDNERTSLLLLLSDNLPRIEHGLVTVQDNIITDASGALFVDGYISWAEKVIKTGNSILQRYGVAKRDMPPLTA